jgi:hypothetical protein
VVVVEPDPAQAERARQRGARLADHADGRFDAVVAPVGWELGAVRAARALLVERDGSVRERR